MVPNSTLLKALRKQRYRFKRQGRNDDVWQKQGSTDRVTIARRKGHDPLYVSRILAQIGMGEDEFEELKNLC